MTTHATTLDISAILAARAAALAAAAVAPTKTSAPATAVLTKTPAPVTTPAVVPTPTVSDSDLAAFVTRSIPVLVSAVEHVARDHSLAQVLGLIQVVSTLVRDGLPQASGADARSIVIAVFTAAVQTYLVPQLPAFVRPFVPGLISAGVHALEAVYQASVKRRE